MLLQVTRCFFLFGLFALAASAQMLPFAAPAAVGMNAQRLARIDSLVNQEIKAGRLPGAVVLIGRKGRVVYRKAFGNRSIVPVREPMTPETVFDLASLTKPLATAVSVMILIENGQLRLNDTIGKFIPDLEDERARRVTILELLTHTSGYAPDFDLKAKWSGRDGMLAALKKERLRSQPGTAFVYSDIGFIVLGEVVERVSGEPLDVFVKKNQFAGLRNTTFRRFGTEGASAGNAAVNVSEIAPTEDVCGQMSYLGSTPEATCRPLEKILRGVVHDPTAYRMNGVAGHAGLFSNADDLAKICKMILDGGVLDGRRILSPQTVARMTAPVVVSETGNTRGLGWDINTPFSSNRGELFPLGSFGHTGFTGTSIWIDPNSETFVIFLSNRVHPDGKGDVTSLRAKVATIAASAITDLSPSSIKKAEDAYNAAVAGQIPRFKENILRSQIAALPILGGPQNILRATEVLNGIDVLEKSGFAELEGKRIGLVTNQTGRNLSGRSTIDILFDAKNVKLTALFSPEHGIRGELDTEKIDDSKDEKTGLPIFSLYGETRRPKPEQLIGLDAIVYDIQDVGTRFYTYTATLRNVLEEAAKAKIPVFVLDRPNPLNGVQIEGPLADGDKLSFIAAHTIPVRYGMTIGELAQMMNTERSIGADLRIVKMEGWSRPMWFDVTGQIWINPSPNMRSLTEATLYPGIGLLETTNLSVGRGTDTPFEVVGAPWIDGRRLAGYLNSRGIAGVRFVPVRFKPNASVYSGQLLGGVNIVITDRGNFNSVRTGLEIAAALARLYPNEWEIDKYSRLLVNADTLMRLKRGDSPEQIEAAWVAGLREFDQRRRRFFLY